MTLRALDIFRIQQNEPSDAFFFQGTFRTGRETVLVYRVHMLNMNRQLPANSLFAR